MLNKWERYKYKETQYEVIKEDSIRGASLTRNKDNLNKSIGKDDGYLVHNHKTIF